MYPTRTFYVSLNEPGEGSEISLQKLKDEGKIPKRTRQFEIKNVIPEENMLVLETNYYKLSDSLIRIRLNIRLAINDIFNSYEWKLPNEFDAETGESFQGQLVKEIVEGSVGDGQTGGRKKSKRKSSRKTRKYSKKSSKKSSKSKNKRRKH